MMFTEWEACITAGLDIERWENDDYSIGLKEKTVAWYEEHLLVEQHGQDASIEQSKRKAKRKGKKR